MPKLEGAITVAGLPPHRGLIVSLCFYSVEAADAPAPYAGDPPAEAATDCHEVVKQVDLNTESLQAAYDLPFGVERPAGFYYVQVRAILFRTQGVKVLAQAEQFFFGRRAIHIAPDPDGAITLPVSWPTQALEELHHQGYGESTEQTAVVAVLVSKAGRTVIGAPGYLPSPHPRLKPPPHCNLFRSRPCRSVNRVT